MIDLLRALFRLVLRIFFQRVEIAGEDRLPPAGPLIFAMNHPNALVDPLFLICLAPRRVSFLAKEPLFRMPVLGWMVRALDCLPVYRTSDGVDTSRNRDTFAGARAILVSGGAIAVFPEGTTHSEPHLKPLKTGAARIALGAASSGDGMTLHLIPTGLYYTQKGIFRSQALVYYGEPIAVAPAAAAEDGEPPREAVQALSARLEDGLRGVTLNADDHRALSVVAIAERIFSSAEMSKAGRRPLLEEFELRQRLLEGYTHYRKSGEVRLRQLEKRLLRYEADLRQAGLRAEDVLAQGFTTSQVLRVAARAAAKFAVNLPLAAIGTVIHYPAYRLIGTVAERFARTDDTVMGTVKIIGSLLFFPLTWLAVAVLVADRLSPAAGAVAMLAAPLTGVAAMRYMERLERFQAAVRALQCYVTRRGFFQHLVEERRAIRQEIVELADALQAPSDSV